jgi:photosystem II stability/assembly factor-like uncharacterized protein
MMPRAQPCRFAHCVVNQLVATRCARHRLRRALLAGMVFVALAALPQARARGAVGTPVWTPIGPTDQDITAAVVDAAHPHTVILATRSAGLFATPDGGQTWVPSVGGLPTSGSISWLGMFPNGGNVVLSLVDGIPYRSSDLGMHWRRSAGGLAQDLRFTSAAIVPGSATTALAGGFNGLFRSDDAGMHWMAVGSGLPSAHPMTFISVSPLQPENLLAGVGNIFSHGGRIFGSTDGGATWHETDHGLPANTIQIQGLWSVTQPSTAWIVSGSIYRTDDAGNHWSRDAFGLPPHGFGEAMAVLRGNRQFVVDNGLPYVRGGGIGAWTMLTSAWSATSLVHSAGVGPDGGPMVATDTGLFTTDSRGFQWDDLAATLPPRSNIYSLLASTDGKTLYAGDDSGVWRLSSQQFWVSTGSGLPVDATVRAIVGLPGPPSRLLCATDYGVYASTTALTGWHMLTGPPAGRPISALTYVASTDTVYAVVVGGGIFQAPTATMHWTSVPNSVPLGYIHVLLVDRGGGWIFTGAARSTDHGTTWRLTRLVSVISAVQDPTDSKVVLAGTAARGLYRSVDSGSHWLRVKIGTSTGGNVAALGATPAPHGSLLDAIVDGLLYASIDHGATWVPQTRVRLDGGITSVVRASGPSEQVLVGTIGGGVDLLQLPSPIPTPFPSATGDTVNDLSPTPVGSSTPTASPTQRSPYYRTATATPQSSRFGTVTTTPRAQPPAGGTPTLTPLPEPTATGTRTNTPVDPDGTLTATPNPR